MCRIAITHKLRNAHVNGHFHGWAAIQYTREKIPPPLPIEHEADWASEQVWIFWNREESLAITENQSTVTR